MHEGNKCRDAAELLKLRDVLRVEGELRNGGGHRNEELGILVVPEVFGDVRQAAVLAHLLADDGVSRTLASTRRINF